MASVNVQEIFTCGICLETFDESDKCPRILSCGHSFCHVCVEKLLTDKPNCPTCQTAIQFSTAESIPINFSLKSLIKIRSQILMPNTSTNLEKVNDPCIGSHAKGDQSISSRKYMSEGYLGYCNDHEYNNGLWCNDCEVWICVMCTIQHEHCIVYVGEFEEMHTELRKLVSQKVEKKLGQRKTVAERLTESLRRMEEETRSLIEEIKRKELELKDREKLIQELVSLTAEENKFCHKLKQLQTITENSTNYVDFSRSLKELEKMLQVGMNQIRMGLHLPQTREALRSMCLSGSVYAVEECHAGTVWYGKVAVKDGRIFINSFDQEQPEDATLFNFLELLSRFNNGSSELPKTVFLQLNLHRGGCEESFEVIIDTGGSSPRARNCILLCSALKGPSFKGETLDCGSFCYVLHTAPPNVVEEISDDALETPLKEGGVYGMEGGNSWFWIQLEDEPLGSDHEVGVVVAGLQPLKDLGGRKCSIEECGLVI